MHHFEANPLVLMSAPMPVVFQGWRSTTADLGRAGWKIAVDFDPNYNAYRFCFSNEQLNLISITEVKRYEWSLRSLSHGSPYDPMYPKDAAPIMVNSLSSSMQVMHYMSGDSFLEGFREIDTEPEVMQHQVITPDDLCIFKYKDNEIDQVIVEQADMTVIEHLEAIKEIQKPKQKELREKLAREERMKAGKVVELLQVA